MKNRGFLLIELLVYLGIFSLIMASSISAFFYLSKDNQQMSKSALTSDEAEFILKKIDWLIINSKIMKPAFNSSSEKLVVKKNTGENIVLEMVDGDIFLKIENQDEEILNNEQVKIDSLNFENLEASEDPSLSIIKTTLKLDGKEFNLARLKYEN